MKKIEFLITFFILIILCIGTSNQLGAEKVIDGNYLPTSVVNPTNPISITQTTETGRYIYDTDFNSAENITEFLISLNLDIELIVMSEILSADWTDVGFVIIGADTGSDGSWGTSEQIDLLTGLNAEFIAFGAGGLSFYENIAGLTVNWQNSMSESIAKIDVNKINTEMWIYPNLMPDSFEFYTADDKAYTLDEGSINSSVVIHGRSRNSTNPLLTYELDRYYFYGIQSVHELWVHDSYMLLENIVRYIINGGIPVTPNVSGPLEVNYSEGSVGNTIDWTLNYILFANYSIYIDGGLIYESQINPGSLLSYPIDGLDVGQYTFSIIVYAVSGVLYINEMTVNVFLEDLTPNLNNPQDIEFWFGENGYSISWVPADSNPENYTIYQNETIYETGNWTSGLPITVPLDNLDIGIHNFTIEIFDQSDQKASDIVIVRVKNDIETPFIEFESNFWFDELEDSKLVNWSASDIHPSQYTIFNDTEIIDEGFWDNEIVYQLNLSSFKLGTYNITFAVADTFGNVAYESTDLLILDLNAPEIEGPTSIYNMPGRTENNIQWTITDNHPNNYTILLDGYFYTNGSWEQYPFVYIDLSEFSTGVYNFTIIAEDTSQNTAIHTVRVYIDVPYLTDSSSETRSTGSGLVEIKTEYLIGAGFVATIVGLGALVRRRTG